MAWYAFQGRRPAVDPSAFVHPEATLIGAVTVGAGCFIGPGARLRADWGPIRIGPGSNVQDNVVIHVAPGNAVQVGSRCHIGHSAILHGCTLAEHVTVGMGAIISDFAEIGSDTIIGAGALVPPRAQIPARVLAVGLPARVLRELRPEELQERQEGTSLYEDLARRCHTELERLPPEPAE